MSDGYTPSTERIRDIWLRYWNISGNPQKTEKFGAQFDAWLAALVREVSEKALRDAADEMQDSVYGSLSDNPSSRWLRRRADFYRATDTPAASAGDTRTEKCPACGGTVGHEEYCPRGLPVQRFETHSPDPTNRVADLRARLSALEGTDWNSPERRGIGHD